MTDPKSSTLDDAIEKSKIFYQESLSLLAAYRKEVGAESYQFFSMEKSVGHCDRILKHTASVNNWYNSLSIDGLEFKDDSLRERVLRGNSSLEKTITSYLGSDKNPAIGFNNTQNGAVYSHAINLLAWYVLLSIAKQRNLKSILPTHVEGAKIISTDYHFRILADFEAKSQDKFEQILVQIGRTISRPLPQTNKHTSGEPASGHLSSVLPSTPKR